MDDWFSRGFFTGNHGHVPKYIGFPPDVPLNRPMKYSFYPNCRLAHNPHQGISNGSRYSMGQLTQSVPCPHLKISGRKLMFITNHGIS